jgi:hypothetical protein
MPDVHRPGGLPLQLHPRSEQHRSADLPGLLLGDVGCEREGDAGSMGQRRTGSIRRGEGVRGGARVRLPRSANGSIVESRPAPRPLPSVRQGQRGTPWRYLFRLHLQALNDIVPWPQPDRSKYNGRVTKEQAPAAIISSLRRLLIAVATQEFSAQTPSQHSVDAKSGRSASRISACTLPYPCSFARARSASPSAGSNRKFNLSVRRRVSEPLLRLATRTSFGSVLVASFDSITAASFGIFSPQIGQSTKAV